MKDQHRILVVDDETSICEVLKTALEDENYLIEVAHNGVDALKKIREFRPSVVLLDIWMPGDVDGMDVLAKVRSSFSKVDVIMMSGHGNIETAVKATKLGAWDFVEKPLSIDRLLILIGNILSYQEEKIEKQTLLNRLRKSVGIVGQSAAIVKVRQDIAQLNQSDKVILFLGEKGVGKSLVAQNIHYLSSRFAFPFLEFNCVNSPQDLLEGELFGLEQGVYSGVYQRQKGVFEEVSKGTLLIDNLSEASLEIQEKVLEALREKKFFRVGGEEPVYLNCRVIITADQNLEQKVKEKTFSKELFEFLSKKTFEIPNLKDRAEDIPLFVDYFSNQFVQEGVAKKKKFSAAVVEDLQNYSWKGNVRELKNFIERIYILVNKNTIDVLDLLLVNSSSHFYEDENSLDFRKARYKFEKDFLFKVIRENNGNISKTAEMIGLERSYLHRKIKTHGINIDVD